MSRGPLISSRRAWMGLVASLAIATAALAPAPALSAGSRTYRGNTSQGRPIFFLTYGAAVNDFWIQIRDRCPRHRTLVVTDHGIPPMKIRRSRFGGTFHASGSVATLVVAGRISGKLVTGRIRDRTKSSRTHRFCSGRATFRLRPS